MKLSEAMMLASMMGEELSNDSWDSCLIGISCRALGEHGDEAFRRWPWLNGVVNVPKSETVWAGCSVRGTLFVTGLCVDVLRGTISVGRAAEIVATVEPQNIQNEQTDGGQVTHPTELSRSDEVPGIAPLNATES